VNVSPLFVTHSQSAKLVQPSERPLHHPSPPAQSAAVFGIALCKKRNNASVPQTSPNRIGIIPAVTHNTLRTVTRMSALSLQKRNGVHQGERLRRVVTISPSELNRQRNTTAVTNQMPLAAQFGPIGRVGTSLLPPKTALIELPSTTARDQSICPLRASQSSRTK
jgi:hypothetical protein